MNGSIKMKREKVILPAITLIGISARTNNKNEVSGNGIIGPTMNHYHQNQLGNLINNRTNPGVLYSVYTEFEDGPDGDYTYFLGEEVSSIEDQSILEQDSSQFRILNIPASTYEKFTTEPGQMPDTVINAWKEIWSMKAEDFAGKRTVVAEFEVYGKDFDPSKGVVDIYIGIES